MVLDKSILSIIIVMGSLVSLVLFLIWLPDEPLQEVPKQTSVILTLPKATPELQLSKIFPDEMKVIIGLNNTVVWKNEDTVSHNIEFTIALDVPSEERFHLVEPGSSFSYKLERASLLQYVIWSGTNGYNDFFTGKVIAVDLSYRPEPQRIITYEFEKPKYVQIKDFPPNSAAAFTYPYTGNETLDQQIQSRWTLIRLSEQYGGNNNDISSFRAYSMVDIQLWCLIRYYPEKEMFADPCHGTLYEPVNGIPFGVAKDYWIKNNALPELDLGVDKEGYIYVKSPVFDVDKNGMVGYGRRMNTNITAGFAGWGPISDIRLAMYDKMEGSKSIFHIESKNWKVRYHLTGDVSNWFVCPLIRQSQNLIDRIPPEDQLFVLEVYQKGDIRHKDDIQLLRHESVICTEEQKDGLLEISEENRQLNDVTNDFYINATIPEHVRSWIIIVEEPKM